VRMEAIITARNILTGRMTTLTWCAQERLLSIAGIHRTEAGSPKLCSVFAGNLSGGVEGGDSALFDTLTPVCKLPAGKLQSLQLPAWVFDAPRQRDALD